MIAAFVVLVLVSLFSNTGILPFIPCVLGCSDHTTNITPEANNLYAYPPVPAGAPLSPQYQAWASTNTTLYPLPVYETANPSNVGLLTSDAVSLFKAYTSFAMSGTVTVAVFNPDPFTSARVLPTAKGVVGLTTGQTFTFTLSEPGQYAIDWCFTGDPCVESNVNLTYPIFIYADAIADLVPSPVVGGVVPSNVYAPAPGVVSSLALATGQDTVYFGPGTYTFGTSPFVLDTDQTAYLAAGAFVLGAFTTTTTVTNFNIVGQGVVSGAFTTKCNNTNSYCPYLISVAAGVTACTAWIQGIIYVDAPLQNNALTCILGTVIENVKAVAWHGNTDFVGMGPNSVLRYSFVSVGDTAIHLANSNVTMHDLVIWHLSNYGLFSTLGGNSNVLVYNIYIIRTEWKAGTQTNNRQGAIVSSFYGLSRGTSNITFNNVYVENSNWQLFKMVQMPFGGQIFMGTPWTGLTFSNFFVTDAQQFAPMLLTENPVSPWTDVAFSNIVVAGQVIDSTLVVGYNQNRPMSLEGNLQYQMLLQSSSDPTLFQVMNFITGAVASLVQPQFDSTFVYQGTGEFFSTGFASIVMQSGARVGIWRTDGGLNTYTVLGQNVPSGYAVVATSGDFNGDGCSDILLWSQSDQSGFVWMLLGAQIVGTRVWTPNNALVTWSFGGVTDVNADGYSDVILQAAFTLEIVLFGPSGAQGGVDVPLSNKLYICQNCNVVVAQHVHWNTSFQLLATGDFHATSYGHTLWINTAPMPSSVDGTPLYALILLAFNGYPVTSPQFGTSGNGQLFYGITATQTVVAVGDVNSDSASDIVVYDTATNKYSVLYMQSVSGNPGLSISNTTGVGGPPSYNEYYAQQPGAGYVPLWNPVVPAQPSLGAITSLQTKQAADTMFKMTWDPLPNATQYFIVLYNGTGTAGAIAQHTRVTQPAYGTPTLFTCANYTFSVQGTNTVGTLGPISTIPIYTACPTLQLSFTVSPDINGTYALVPMSNRALCVGIPNYSVALGAIAQLFPCERNAENMFFVWSNNDLLLLTDYLGGGVRFIGSQMDCNLAGSGAPFGIVGANSPQRSELTYDKTTLQLSICAAEYCLQYVAPPTNMSMALCITSPTVPITQQFLWGT